MMSTVITPAMRTGPDPVGLMDTRLELVFRAHTARSQVTLRVLIDLSLSGVDGISATR
jgi:hypothetical protein